jgi:hypothetical protein
MIPRDTFTRHPRRMLTFFETSCLISNQHGLSGSQMVHHRRPHIVPEGIGVPRRPSEQMLDHRRGGLAVDCSDLPIEARDDESACSVWALCIGEVLTWRTPLQETVEYSIGGNHLQLALHADSRCQNSSVSGLLTWCSRPKVCAICLAITKSVLDGSPAVQYFAGIRPCNSKDARSRVSSQPKSGQFSSPMFWLRLLQSCTRLFPSRLALAR